jgi:hypothetical protein
MQKEPFVSLPISMIVTTENQQVRRSRTSIPSCSMLFDAAAVCRYNSTIFHQNFIAKYRPLADSLEAMASPQL